MEKIEGKLISQDYFYFTYLEKAAIIAMKQVSKLNSTIAQEIRVISHSHSYYAPVISALFSYFFFYFSFVFRFFPLFRFANLFLNSKKYFYTRFFFYKRLSFS